jgi:serine/threonine protein kinase
MASNEGAPNMVGKLVQMPSNDLSSGLDAVPDLVSNRMPFTADLPTVHRVLQLLKRNPPTADKDHCQRTAIMGLGGVGKTQIALEAAFRVRDEHPDCYFFFDNPPTFVNEYPEIGRWVDIAGIDHDKADVNLASLYTRLTAALKEGSSLAMEPSSFLPVSELDRLITPKIVAAELAKARVSNDDALSRVVYTDYRKIFASLIMTSKPSAILEFVCRGVDDRRLPIPYKARDEIVGMLNDEDDQLRSLFMALEADTAEAFLKWQHVINPPQLELASNGATQRKPHASFHEQAVLPFTHVEQSNSGGYGTIFRVQIHPDHHQGYQPSQEGPKSAPPCFAIKKLRSPDERDFAREVNAFQKLSRAAHPHIVPFLGSFQLGQEYHLIFPWADSDLSTFWRLNPKPKMDAKLGAWMTYQLLGIADALTLIHGSESLLNDAENGNGMYGRHGDIKPSNILCFKEKESLGDHQSYFFKLADFGSAQVWEPGWKSAQLDDMPRATPVYRAPEWDLEPRKTSRAYDIWSLGCIFLECTTWIIHGGAGLDALAALRRDPRSDDPSRDAFFHYVGNSSGQLEARLKPKVVEVSAVFILFFTATAYPMLNSGPLPSRPPRTSRQIS